tara:strand:- start:249 stop:791 length:543 start_codon:yes stop_codon:yes gene_type:complete
MQTRLDSFTAKPKPVRNKKGRRHKNPNGTSWCGPTALTVLTGKRYDIIEKDLLKLANKYKSSGGFNLRTASFVRKPKPKVKEIKGMHNSEMRKALNKYGYSMKSSDMHGSSKTFRQWTKETYGKRGKKWFLVQAGYHYLVVKGNKVWDTNTPEEGIPITKARWYKRARMQTLFEVERIRK